MHRNLFDIKMESIESTPNAVCSYCGEEIDMSTRNRKKQACVYCFENRVWEYKERKKKLKHKFSYKKYLKKDFHRGLMVWGAPKITKCTAHREIDKIMFRALREAGIL